MPKPRNLNEYRCNLINKILLSRSEEEIRRYIDAALKSLQYHNVHGHITMRFIEKLLQELDRTHERALDPRECSNIRSAGEYVNLMKMTLMPVQ
ncbi:hypothetical protein [Flavihumibacter sp.]|uniref:hypothetical protein n=1 Tax=Flavihumibacter sp. TaxID=1913981 RepID=UPI002FCBF380|nr:hypothetical protein [Flavihumibacter sediminis]